MSAAPIDLDLDQPSGSPTPEELIIEPPLEELSPTERHLDSLRVKLTGQLDTVSGEEERTQRGLAATRTNIDALKQRLAHLEKEVLRTHATLNQATGLAYALRETVGQLRLQETGERGGDGVGELRILIKTEQARAREIAVALVGNSPYTDKFLNSPSLTIDDGKASGLIFEIKNTLQTTVSDRRIKQTQAAGNRVTRREDGFGKREAEYREAETHYENALTDLANAETKRDDLLEQVRHSLQTIRLLEEAIRTADRVAVRIEEQGQKHEREDMALAGREFDESMAAYEKAKLDLAAAESHRAALEPVLAEMRQAEDRLTQTIEKIMAVPAVYSRGAEVNNKVPAAGQRLLRIRGELEGAVVEASHGIDPTILQIGDEVSRKIDRAFGYSRNEGDNAFDELEKATARLTGLLETLETDCALADASEPPANLNWGAITKVLETADEIDRFLKNEWPRLKAGTLGNAEAIAAEARNRLEATLKPLAVLRRACEELSGKPQVVDATAEAVAPAAAATVPASLPVAAEYDIELPPPPKPEIPADLDVADVAVAQEAGPAPVETAAEEPASKELTETQPLPPRRIGRRGANEE